MRVCMCMLALQLGPKSDRHGQMPSPAAAAAFAQCAAVADSAFPGPNFPRHTRSMHTVLSHYGHAALGAPLAWKGAGRRSAPREALLEHQSRSMRRVRSACP